MCYPIICLTEYFLPSIVPSSFIEALLDYGFAAQKRLDLDMARSTYERALLLHPLHPRALYLLALFIAVVEDSWGGAIRLLEKSAELSPRGPTLLNLAKMYVHEQRHLDAIWAWEQAFDQDVAAGGVLARSLYASSSHALALQMEVEEQANNTRLQYKACLVEELRALHMAIWLHPPSLEIRYGFDLLSKDEGSTIRLEHELHSRLAECWQRLSAIYEWEETWPVAYRLYQKSMQSASLAAEVLNGTRNNDTSSALQQNMSALIHRIRASKSHTTRPEQVTALLFNDEELLQADRSIDRLIVDEDDINLKHIIHWMYQTCHFPEAHRIATIIGDNVVFRPTAYSFLHEDEQQLVKERIDFSLALDMIVQNVSMKGLWDLRRSGIEWCHHRFFLAYHGRNNRELNSKLASTYLHLAPGLNYTSPRLLGMRKMPDEKVGQIKAHNGALAPLWDGIRKIRIGFFSAFLYYHPVGRSLQGYIEHLPRDRFEVIALFVPLDHSYNDTLHAQIRHQVNKMVILPAEDVKSIRHLVEKEELDVLLYGDIGMEVSSFLTAFSRLAPVQALTFGHPDTSGIDTVDYFLSHASMDEDGPIGPEFYTEQLVRLPGVGYWVRSETPLTKLTRTDVGLSDEQLELDTHWARHSTIRSTQLLSAPWTMYLITKSFQFFSPIFIEVIAEILFRHPRSFVAIVSNIDKLPDGSTLFHPCHFRIERSIRNHFNTLKQRLSAVLAEDVQSGTNSSTSPRNHHPLTGRIRFVPPGPRDYFLSLLLMTDILLQPMPLDGTTTTLEAISMATPTVIYRGPMIGGRMGYAIYRHMGLNATVTTEKQEYIDIAVRLGTDRTFNHFIRQQLRALWNHIFEDPQAIQSLVLWIQAAVERIYLEVEPLASQSEQTSASV